MKIAFITKYPPIEGGISSQAYWLIKGLGEKNIKVDVISNCWEVERKYRIDVNSNDLKHLTPKNVCLFSTDPFENINFIPYFNPFGLKITDLALKLSEDNDYDLIDSWYLMPYGISAFIINVILQKPFLLRHGGSDITRLYKSGLNSVFSEVIKKANFIITSSMFKKRFLDIGVKNNQIKINEGTLIDLDVFNPDVKPLNLSKYFGDDIECPIIIYMGKFTEHKGIFELINVTKKLNDKDFKVLLVTNDDENNTLKKYIKNKGMENKIFITNFMPPWRIPSLINASTSVILPECNFPVQIHNPRLGREVLACGKCLIISKDLTRHRPYSSLKDGENSIIIDPRDPNVFKEKMKLVIDHPEITNEIGKNGRKFAEQIEDYDRYVRFSIKVYKELKGE